MAFYKHYSFDLWLTLIKSNPAFKKERTIHFFKHYNTCHKSIEEIAIIFRQVDLMVNAINERTGKNIDAEEMYLMVISQINNYKVDLAEIDIDDLYRAMEELLLENMPLLYCDACLDVLSKIKEVESSTNILSNTGFIKGNTLRKILNHLKIDPFIDFQLYSDEVRMSKPNKGFFQLMLNTIDRQKHPELLMSDVIHVGDNPIADRQGAHSMGIKSMLINSNHLSISNLLL